jgi:hypothetical protein
MIDDQKRVLSFSEGVGTQLQRLSSMFLAVPQRLCPLQLVRAHQRRREFIPKCPRFGKLKGRERERERGDRMSEQDERW